MTLIEGIGDEVTQFFITLFAVIIVTIAWWTTNITEQRHVRTVLLLDRRPNSRFRRGFRLPRTLTNHTETVTISEVYFVGTPPPPVTNVMSTGTESEDQSTTPNIETSSVIPKSTEASTSTNTEVNSTDSITSSGSAGQEETEEQDNIIETMDADQNVVRQRRLAFYSSNDGTNIQPRKNTTLQPDELPQPSSSSVNSLNVETRINEPSNDSLQQQSTNIEVETEIEEENQLRADTSKEKNEAPNDKSAITVKLKFMNDDLKVVDGRLDELLGDFKKRHFETELSSNKVIKLIFQGQVLKQDRITLQGCGLFDNCVVHCLIHQKRISSEDRQDSQSITPRAENIPDDYFPERQFLGVRRRMNNNNQGIDWDLGNFLFALISFILLAAWYFRYVYAHLYTVTATVGLILITGIFTIVLVGMYFPDNEQLPNPSIRIARAERVETH